MTGVERNPQKFEEIRTLSVQTDGRSIPSELRPKLNQDTFFVLPWTAGVFDGVGSAMQGKQAAEKAKSSMEERLKKLSSKTPNLEERLKSIMLETDTFLSRESGHETTATLAAIRETDEGYKLITANIGDSRVYLFRNGRIEQITLDDSDVSSAFPEKQARELQSKLNNIASMRDFEKLSEEEKAYFIDRNVITQFLGSGGATPKVKMVDLREGQSVVLLTSDGIHDNLVDTEIAAILDKYSYPATAVGKLIEAARARSREDPNPGEHDFKKRKNPRSKPDDMTVVILRVNITTQREPISVEIPPAVTKVPTQREISELEPETVGTPLSVEEEDQAESAEAVHILPVEETSPAAPPRPEPHIPIPATAPASRPSTIDVIRDRARRGEEQFKRDRATGHRRRNVINGVVATVGLGAFVGITALLAKEYFFDEGIKTEAGRFYTFHKGVFSIDQVPDDLNFFFPELAMRKEEYEMHPADLLLSAGLPAGLIEKFARNGTRIVFADSPGGGDVELRNWLWADKMLSVAATIGEEAKSGILIASADRNGVAGALKVGFQAMVGDVSSPGFLLRVRRDAHKSASDAVGGLQNYCSARVLDPLPRNFTTGDLRNPTNRNFVKTRLVGHRKLFDELSRYLRT